MLLLKKLSAIIIVAVIVYGGYRTYRHFMRKPQPPLPVRTEVTLTIIPGWNLRQVADYLVLKGFASSTQDVYYITGIPGKDYRTTKLQSPELIDADGYTVFPDRSIRNGLSYEGFFSPETIRVFKDATAKEIVIKFLQQREKELAQFNSNPKFKSIIDKGRIMTMASLVEDEARTTHDRQLVADILWRRVAKNWALQLDSTVHYAVDKMGDVYTTGKERDIDSPWNTYKYPGLPPGPICNPSIESIQAALDPEPNTYWYFLSGRDGAMHYAKTLEEHNANKKYL